MLIAQDVTSRVPVLWAVPMLRSIVLLRPRYLLMYNNQINDEQNKNHSPAFPNGSLTCGRPETGSDKG